MNDQNYYGEMQPQTLPQPKPPAPVAVFLLQATGAVVAGAVLAGTGLFLCFTVIGILPGIGLIIASGLPLGIVMGRRIKSLKEWEHRDQPLLVNESKPWE